VLFLVDNQWVKPTQTAVNPKTGANAFLVNNEWQTMPMPGAATDRSFSEALITDPLSSLLSGTGTMLGSPGQLKQLITGEKRAEEKPKGTIESLAQTLLPFGTDLSKIPEKVLEKLTPTAPTIEGVTGAVTSPFRGLQPVGEELKAFGEKQKSTGLKAAEKGREKAIQEAEGFLPEVGAAIGETVKNPALLSSFIFEQIPNFVGTLGGGALTKEAARGFFKDATEKTLGKIGVSGAIATGGAMQAGDIGSETYQTIYDRLVKEGTQPDQAHLIALEKGRMAAAQAGAISIASSFIPGGKALERRFLTEAGKKAGFPGFVPAVGNIVGETVQEGTEEGGGKLVSNIQAAQVFPDIDVMKGVGAATGFGALGGGMFGGISNVPSALSRAPAEAVPPSGEVPPAVPPAAPPAGPAIPLEAQLEEAPAAVRLAELQRAMQEVDQAFQNPDLTPDDFRQLNTVAAQIRTQIAQVQSGQAPAVTPVTPQEPIAPPAIEAVAPQLPVEAPPVESPSAHAPTVTPVTPEAPIQAPPPVEAAPPVAAPPIDLKSEQAYRMKYAVDALDKGETKLTPRNVNPLAKELGIKPGATPEETLANVKQVLGIEAAPKSVAPEATEVVQEPAQVEQPTEAQKRLDSFLSEDKDYIVKELAASYRVSPEYAEKAYNAEKEYREAEVKYHFPELINSPEFEAAYKKHTTFFNKLRAVSAKQKAKETESPKEKTQTEINKARQAEKKAAAVITNEEKLVDAIQSLAYKNGFAAPNTANDFIAKYGKKMFDEAVASGLLDNEPGEGRLFPSNKYAYEVSHKYYDAKGKKIKVAKEEKPVEVKPKIEELVSPEVASAMKDIEFQKRLIKANNEKALTEAQFSKVFNLQQSGKTAEADAQLTKILYKKVKKPEPVRVADETSEAVNTFAKALIEKTKGKEAEISNYFINANAKTAKEIKILENSIAEVLRNDSLDEELKKKLTDIQQNSLNKETHIEGKTSEPVTSKTIEEAIDKAESNVDYNKIKTAVKNQFDQAIKRAKIQTEKEWAEAKGLLPAEKFVTIDVPGDGKFKVKNNVERLKELQTKMVNAVVPKVAKEPSGPSSGSLEAFKGMVDDKDMENAIEYAKLKGLDPKTVKLNPTQRNIVDKYIKNPSEFERQQEEQKGKGPFYNNFEPDFTEADFDNSVDDVRKEKIKEQAVTSRRLTSTVKKIADMGSDIASQYELNRLATIKKALADEIEAMKQPKTLPEDVVARAAKERAEFERTNGLDGLSPEAYAVLEKLYQKYPDILNGLKLSVRRTERRGVTGSFDPIERLVTIYKKGISVIFGGGGEQQARTMRHEIAHTLEQMMSPEVKKVLVNAWANSLGKAIEKYKGDKVYQDYFDAVMDFIENPTQTTYKKATDLMPDYSMYQYISPSEYWAVNAEPLLDAQLGGAWQRFTKAVKGLWEAIKSVFGFDNRYAVHREFNRIMSGDQQRISKRMLVDYLDQTGVSRKFINNIEEETNLIDDLNFPEVPEHEQRSMKDMAVAGYRKMQDLGKEFGDNPGKTATKSLISASDAITKQRIENVYFAAGTDKRDQARYDGQIRAADGLMAASIAIKNAIHSAHISTQVIIEGGIEYSKVFGQIVAKKSEHSMANVVKLEHAIKQKLGNKLGLQIVNAYFIAKRSRSIQNEFLNTSNALRAAQESGDFAAISEIQSDYNSIKIAYEKIPGYFRQLNKDGKPTYQSIKNDNGEIIERIPILNDEAIDKAIGMEKNHPELKKMMENWTAVNKEMLDIMEFSGRISKKTAQKLKDIKDYVPWYRIMDDQENIHDGSLVSNLPGGPKRFKAGETDRDIDNVVESMIHNVVMMTRGATKTYAINRVISEYGQRYEDGPKKGKLMVFPSEGRDAEGTRIASFIGGRRVITNIPDDLVADSVLGLIAAPFTFPLQGILSAASNGFRRSITFTPWFQVKQLIIDAPTAAWVSGVRNPFKLWAGVFSGFVNALEITGDDPTVQILRNAGVGGFQSFHRSAKKEREIQLGLLKRSNYAAFLNAIDKVGDASDLAQRVSVYKRVLAESGDPALALLQASDIIDFQKHGKGRLAQAMRTTVTFMQAYATQLDALAQASIGGNLKGKPRAEAKKQFLKTGMMLASTTLLYAMMAGADDDYWELDDQTRLRNFYIPGSKKATGHHILIPMTTSASFFFKAIPELLHNKIVSEGTKNEMDARRTWKALGTMAVDSLLGPNPVPSGAKPIIEIAINRNFFTGGDVVPKGLEGLESAEQYNASTSNLGHVVSKLTGGVLNPIQADHLMRGMGGSVATLGMYFSNLAFPDDRPEPELKQNPIIGNLVAPEVSRKNEELFYDLREKATGKYETYQSMLDTDKFDEADKFYDKNQSLIDVYEYVSSMDTDLKEINKEIRRFGKSADKEITPKERTKEINELKKLKSEILDNVTEFRKEAGF
jgi:hypothetical protein